jgi:hypothetical protein
MAILQIIDRQWEAAFLRMYAKNLNRSYRNDPANACSDAQIQMSTTLLMAIFILFLLAGSMLFPIYLREFFRSGNFMYGSLIAIGLFVIFGVQWRFGRYERTPESARPYISKHNSRWSLAIYWSVMILSLVVIWIVLAPKRH